MQLYLAWRNIVKWILNFVPRKAPRYIEFKSPAGSKFNTYFNWQWLNKSSLQRERCRLVWTSNLQGELCKLMWTSNSQGEVCRLMWTSNLQGEWCRLMWTSNLQGELCRLKWTSNLQGRDNENYRTARKFIGRGPLVRCQFPWLLL